MSSFQCKISAICNAYHYSLAFHLFYRLTDFEQEELASDLVSSFMIPELHRLYHNSQIDAAGARFNKASEQVVDAIFCAHPVTKKIIDELEPIVDEHLTKSTAALDGGVETVDMIITKAVEVALKPFADSLYADHDHSQSTESQHTTESYSTKSTTTPSTDTKTTDSSDKTVATAEFLAGLKKKKASSDFDFRFDAGFGMALSFEPLPQKKEDEKGGEGDDEEEEGGDEDEAEGDEEEGDREVEKEDLKTEYEESSLTVADSRAFDEAGDGEDEEDGDEEEEQTTPPLLRFYVTDDVVRSLAAKSVQVEYDTELGQQVCLPPTHNSKETKHCHENC